MAHDIARLKYPESHAAYVRHREVMSINASELVLPHEKTSEHIAAVTEVDTKIKSMQELDVQIANLIMERDMQKCIAIAEMEKAVAPLTFSFNERDKLYTEWTEHNGIEANAVKAAVKRVRDIFFNDTDSIFHSIVLIDINFETYNQIEFKFRDRTHNMIMSIIMPLIERKHECRSKKLKFEDYRHFLNHTMRHDDRLTNAIGFEVLLYDINSIDVVSFHYDARIVREQIRRLVTSGFAIPESDNEVWMPYSDKDCREYRMSLDDYWMEAEKDYE